MKNINKDSDAIRSVVDNVIMTEYSNVICGYNIKEIEDVFLVIFYFKDIEESELESFINELWQSKSAFDNLLNEFWEIIYDYTGIAVGVSYEVGEESWCNDIESLNESKDNNLKDNLKKQIETNGLEDTANLVGGLENLIKIVYDGDFKSYFKDRIKGTILYQTEIQDPDNFEDAEEYADFCMSTAFDMYFNDDYDDYDYDDDYDDYSLPEKNLIRNFEPKELDKILNELYDELQGELYDELINTYNDFEDSDTNLNESKEDKNINVIKTIYDTLNIPGLCSYEVTFNEYDQEYEIRTKLNREYYKLDDHSYSELNDEFDFLQYSLNDMGIRCYILTPYYVDDCKDDVKFLFENEEKDKLTLVKNLIHQLFDDVKFIEVVSPNKSKGYKKPLIKVYFENDSEAANEESFFAMEIYRTIYDYTGIVVLPYWKTDWADVADFYLDTKRIKYDENKNVVNESFVDSENDYEKYKNVISDLIYEYFDKNDICGVELDPFRFEEDETDSMRIKIIFKEQKDFRDFLNLKKQLKETIRTYIPLFHKVFITRQIGFCPDNITEAHKVDPNEYVELFRNDDFILTIPLTHSASKKYGSDAKWCTTKKDCDKDFKRHLELGVLGYIVIRNNELKEKLGSNAFAIYRLFGDGVGRSLVFDDQNNEYKNGETWISNKFDRVDKLFQFYTIINKFNDYFDQKKETKIIKEAKDYSNILDMIKTFNIVDTLNYTGIVPTKLPRLIDITQIPNEKIFEFLDHISSTQSPWITEYEIQPIEMEDDYGRIDVIESFGAGSVDITKYEDGDDIESYSVEYELLTKDVFYMLFKIALFMYGKDDNNIFENADKTKSNEDHNYKKIEEVLNSIYSEKYDWWKDIKINDIKFGKKPFYVMTIDATIDVDEEWGATQWMKYYDTYPKFPGNIGWNTGMYWDRVSLGDIAGGEFMSDFKEELIDTMRYLTNKEIVTMQVSPLKLKFV
jgi:hypothetical protein